MYKRQVVTVAPLALVWKDDRVVLKVHLPVVVVQEVVLVPQICQGGGKRGRGGGYSFVACLRHLTIDHARLSRRSTGGSQSTAEAERREQARYAKRPGQEKIKLPPMSTRR